MFSRRAIQELGLALALGSSLSLAVAANPDEMARHFAPATELFVAGRALPRPQVMAGLLNRLEANPLVELLMDQFPLPGTVSLKDDVLPWVEGQVAIAWVRTEEKSAMDRRERRDLQESSYRYLTTQLTELGQQIEKFQRKYKRLPENFKELVTKKLRTAPPHSDQAEFQLQKGEKGWVVTTSYKGELGLAELADPPRYEKGRGLVENDHKPRPALNLLVSLKCADETLARKTLAKLCAVKPDKGIGLSAVDPDHWTVTIDAKERPWNLQFAGGWLIASDNADLLARYQSATPQASLADNARYKLQRQMLPSSQAEEVMFAFVDIADLVNTTSSLGDLPPIARIFGSIGATQRLTLSPASDLPTSTFSEAFLEIHPPTNQSLSIDPPAAAPANTTNPEVAPADPPPPPTPPPDGWEFLSQVPRQSSTVYAFNLGNGLKLLDLAGKWDGDVERMWSGLYAQMQKATTLQVTPSELGRSSGWLVAETEIFDQMYASFNDFRNTILNPGENPDNFPATFLAQLPRLPFSWSAEISDPGLRDKLAKSLWDAVGDKSAEKKVGPSHYWMRQDGAWALSVLTNRLAASGRLSKRLFLRNLGCAAGSETSLADEPTLQDFRGRLRGRPLLFTHQKVDWLYSIVKGILLAVDSQTRPEAEVLGRYRDTYGAVTLEPQGFRAYAAFYSAEGPATLPTRAPSKDLLRLRDEMASDFKTHRAATETAKPDSAGTLAEQGQLTNCKSNLKNIATALEMYASDNAGRYPKSLKLLTPNYLKVIPECPSAGKDTYSAHYRWDQKPNTFGVYCWGRNHAACKVPNNRPCYNAEQGLIEK